MGHVCVLFGVGVPGVGVPGTEEAADEYPDSVGVVCVEDPAGRTDRRGEIACEDCVGRGRFGVE